MSVISAVCRRSGKALFLLLWAFAQGSPNVWAGGYAKPLRGEVFDRAGFPNPHAHIPAQCYVETSGGTQNACLFCHTDGVTSTEIVPFRDLFLLIFPVTFTLKPFLAKKGHAAEDVEKMHAAWVKSCLLQVTLWSHSYVKDGDF